MLEDVAEVVEIAEEVANILLGSSFFSEGCVKLKF